MRRAPGDERPLSPPGPSYLRRLSIQMEEIRGRLDLFDPPRDLRSRTSPLRLLWSRWRDGRW